MKEGKTKSNVKYITQKGRQALPPPPPFPLSRKIREGTTIFCECGSTMTKKGFLMLFGNRSCDQPKCNMNKRKD